MTPDAERLIPLAIQHAVRDAVGGWGPYTLAQIEDLFTSHGFHDRAEPPLPARGERRTLAEEFHAALAWRSAAACERYRRLVEEVLDDLGDGDETKDRLLSRR